MCCSKSLLVIYPALIRKRARHWTFNFDDRLQAWRWVVTVSPRGSSGKLHKDYTVYEDVKSILPIYIHVYPVRPCRDDLCEIIPSIWGAVARYDRSDLFIIACGQSHLFMNMLWSAMISCELTYHVATVLLVSCGGVFAHKDLVLSLSSKGYRHNTCI